MSTMKDIRYIVDDIISTVGGCHQCCGEFSELCEILSKHWGMLSTVERYRPTLGDAISFSILRDITSVLRRIFNTLWREIIITVESVHYGERFL